ncbi:sensor histidine kinase [Gulosibacter molinativorax]|uniref:histidine kinase n=1 Tax=Gulosibacter molinativorax TaxID=256821 RepID=A0ABT7CB58_9MICO|nr:ATP-binding protein [Gulosibacter molinativorax]MDJ1372431.1 ATP-binding protein [Gulosibacter molinativorax]QUY61204.1 Histidine kinase [Gulosibacter molinativorax]
MSTTNSTSRAAPNGKGALRPRARLLRTLGNDLISSDKVALIELVKNSYDADATTVLIRFHGPLDEGAGRIEVWDDGHGMDVETLQRSWLDIATDTKRRKPKSSGGRRVLGEKGIGRLAAARLGSELLLITRREGSSEVSLLMDWTQFDREDAYLDEIEVAWEVNAADVFSDGGRSVRAFSGAGIDAWKSGHGTLLQIEKLTHTWTQQDFIELRTALTRLIRPRPIEQDSQGLSNAPESAPADFQIILELEEVQEDLQTFAGPIDPSAELRVPHYQLRGSVDSNGSAKLHFRQQDPSIDEDLGIKTLWNNNKRGPQAGPFQFEINVWDRDNDAIQRTLASRSAESTPSTSKELKGFREALDDLAGVSIYRDGFRVLPFGEKGDDWLGLDLRRVQSPTLRLSNNQIVGHVFIEADTNQGLKDQSNREGFLAGTAYADLQTLVRAALAELETRRYKARRPEKSPTEQKGGLFERFNLGEIREALSTQYPRDSRILDLIDVKNRDIQEGVAEVQQVLSRYSRLATLGSLIDRVLHDGRTVVTRLKNIARFGERDLKKPALSTDEKIAASQKAMEQTAEQAEMLSSLFNQIEPFGGRKRGRPKQLHTQDLIEKAVSIMQVEADDRGVQLITGDTDISTHLDEAEALLVLVNLINNAIYWTATQPQDVERKVMVDARSNSDSSLTFIVSDSGPGVPDDLRNRIFDPYFSSKPDGVGLGLTIVGNMVEDVYAGELALVQEGQLGGATFEATFRRRV